MSSYHVRQLAEALSSGAVFPPIVVERKSSRVVDGFHRVEALRRVRGREALVEAVEKDYRNEAELVLDAMRLNARHGSRLSPYDQLRCVEIASRLSIDGSRLAQALSVSPDYVGELSARRMGSELGTRAPVPLKRTIQHMRGRALTPAQMAVNKKLGGQSQSFYANQLVLLLENDLLDRSDARLLELIARLKELLGAVAA